MKVIGFVVAIVGGAVLFSYLTTHNMITPGVTDFLKSAGLLVVAQAQSFLQWVASQIRSH
jgi:hypothetical protein